MALIGSSGVGKSTIVNALLGWERQATGEVREDDQRGRHTTTMRELLVTPSGALLLDSPGMRSVGMWDVDEGLADAFADVEALRQPMPIHRLRARRRAGLRRPGGDRRWHAAAGASREPAASWRASRPRMARRSDPQRAGPERATLEDDPQVGPQPHEDQVRRGRG